MIHLLSSPQYYGQFNGAHERFHRSLKANIEKFSEHQNLSKLSEQINQARETHNYHQPVEILNMQTPANIFYCDENFIPKDCEVVTPYQKNNELRIKYTNRDGKPARMVITKLCQPKPPDQESTT